MNKADWRTRLNPALAAMGVRLAAAEQKRLLQYIELLQQWNKAYNLTAVRDPDEMLTKHVLDSLAVLPFLHGPRVLDVGTGAGLPGIPLALARPELQFTLLDSNGKKTRFVTHAVATLALKNVEVLQARVEDYRPAVAFATVISRAFASLGDFVRLAGHACAPAGRLLAMKGAPPDAELKELPAGFRLKAVHPLKVPGLDAERCLVEIEKTAS
jgi:16S rRNA (guanine527-N7)-methyltransferase